MFKCNTEPESLEAAHSTGAKVSYFLVTDGLDYATTSAMEDETIAAVVAAEKASGVSVKHFTVAGSPKFCQKLGVTAVPTLVKVVGDSIDCRMVGICNAHQYEAFLTTGVPPV